MRIYDNHMYVSQTDMGVEAAKLFERAGEATTAGLDRDYLNALVFDTFAEAEAFLVRAFEDNNAVKPMRRLRWRTPREYHEEVVKIAK